MLRRFDVNRDYMRMCRWYDSWGMTPPPMADLPIIGFVVDECVMSFLYKCEGKMGLWEGTVSDPECTKEQRQAVYPVLMAAIEKEAKEAGIKYLLAWTKNPSILTNLEALGFKSGLSYWELIKELK